jgi:hypothetical protein
VRQKSKTPVLDDEKTRTLEMPRDRAALGLRAHSGWAALVAVAGTRGEIRIVERRRVELGDPSSPGPKQPYHEAEGEPLAKARRIVERFANDARRRALETLRSVLQDLGSRGHQLGGCGLLTASNRPLPDLASILNSHALIHTADGELFREAIASAAQECGLPLLRVRERELLERAAEVLRAPRRSCSKSSPRRAARSAPPGLRTRSSRRSPPGWPSTLDTASTVGLKMGRPAAPSENGTIRIRVPGSTE